MKGHVLYFLTAVLFTSSLDQIHGVAFYPFGNDANDLQVPGADDYALNVSLISTVLFYGKTFTQLSISTNGVIFFGIGSSRSSSPTFPTTGLACVAPYWADCDTRTDGKIFYREEFNPHLLTSISSEIRSKQISSSSYSSTWAFIVTFDDVPRYDCRLPSCSQVVKHQTILTGNKVKTFAILLYEKLGFVANQIGINAGDGRTYLTLPYSDTNPSSIYPLQNSNVGEPGKWIFPISNCTQGSEIDIFPMKVIYFGGQKVSITGFCFESLETIEVKFGQTAVSCSIKDDEEIVCISPYIDTIGKVTVTVEHDSRSYTGFITTHDESDDSVKETKIDLSTDSLDSSVYFNWSETLETNILLSGMQEDIALDANGNVVSLNRRQISMEIPNIGNYEYFPDQFEVDSSFEESVDLKIRKIYLSINTTVIRRIIISSVIEDTCSLWYSLQPNGQEINEIVDRESRRNPCMFKIVFPSLNFEVDDTCQSFENSWCSFFHPGAKTCYRSINNPSGVGVQCCYNEDSHLMTGPSGGGTLNMQDPKQSEFWHFMKDVLPYLLCCKLQSKCDRYYEKRPSINSTYFTTPGIARAHGDPHFTTVDGTSYDFNPVGEYIFLQAPDLMVQARMSAYGNEPSSGSYFSAFAIASSGSEVVQFKMYYGTLRVTYGNTILYTGIWSFETISLNISSSTLVLMQTPHGFMMQVQCLGEALHVIVILSQNLKGNVYGLIGNWDDDPINDLMLPNKTFISTRSTTRNIHYSFGLQWTTTVETSIFLYENFNNWWSYQNRSFNPHFSIPSKYYICNNDNDCNLDYDITGSISIALANINIKQIAKYIQKMYKEISETCIVNVSIPNGFVDVTSYPCDPTRADYKFGCNPGYSLQGSQTVTCSKGKYSDEFAKCYEFEDLPNHDK